MNCARSAPPDRGHFLVEKCILSSLNAIFSPLRGRQEARYARPATRGALRAWAVLRTAGRPYRWSDPTYETQPESLLRALMATLSAVSGDGDAGGPSPHKAEAGGTDPELEVSICDATPSVTTTVFQ